LHRSLCVIYLHILPCFLFSKVPTKEIGALSKNIKIPYFHFLQCARSDFFIFTSHMVFYILTKQTYFFFFQRYLPKKKLHFQKLYKITNLHFSQFALSDFFIFASQLVLYLRTQFSIFSSFKGTYERNRCTLKKMVKSHLCFFTVRPVRFIYLCIKVSVLLTNTVYNVFFFQKYLLKELVAL